MSLPPYYYHEHINPRSSLRFLTVYMRAMCVSVCASSDWSDGSIYRQNYRALEKLTYEQPNLVSRFSRIDVIYLRKVFTYLAVDSLGCSALNKIFH